RREFLRRRFLNAITFGPRLWSSTSTATDAPATVGRPRIGVSPPTTRTSLSCTIVPTSPSILPTSKTSSGTTRYCRPPVLMTANIVFSPCSIPASRLVRPGRLFDQSLWVYCEFCAGGSYPFENPRKNKRREKRPAPVVRTYSRRLRRVKENCRKEPG